MNFLKNRNIDTIIDDTEDSLPAKMKKFNLIGIPYQIILGKNYKENEIEFKEIGLEIKKLSINQILEIIIKKLKN